MNEHVSIISVLKLSIIAIKLSVVAIHIYTVCQGVFLFQRNNIFSNQGEGSRTGIKEPITACHFQQNFPYYKNQGNQSEPETKKKYGLKKPGSSQWTLAISKK